MHDSKKWISVNSKLPKNIYPYHEPSPEVLIKYSWGFKIARQFSCGTWVDDHGLIVDAVTHWMTLPEEPKE